MNTSRRGFLGLLAGGAALPVMLPNNTQILPLKTVTYIRAEGNTVVIPEGTFQPNTTVIITLNSTYNPEEVARLVKESLMQGLKASRQLSVRF